MILGFDYCRRGGEPEKYVGVGKKENKEKKKEKKEKGAQLTFT